jgi:hypothetical protein
VDTAKIDDQQSATRVSFGGLELVDEKAVMGYAGDKLDPPRVVVVLENSDLDAQAEQVARATALAQGEALQPLLAEPPDR